VSRAGLFSRVFYVFVGIVTVLYLAQDFGRGTHLFTDVLTPSRVAFFGSVAKLGPQLLGCVYAARCAQHYGKGNAARRAWVLMSAWLGSWFAGQLVLVTYERILAVPAPIPSLGDVFFTAGSAFVIVALSTFIRAYRASGFAVGSASELMLIAVGACAVFGVAAYVFLVPAALAPTPFAERLVNVGYPLLDLATLIPALVLLRIAVRFRGGRVWPAWGALLAGILFATGGDLVFSDFSPTDIPTLAPIADLLFILGYSFCAYGVKLQYELVTE
jgi:hypothetical protein